ncbi:hypothetical protein H4Q26_016087 [Puccinia striiformis f. sp. tritici PST-130]|nr:hypothetical protein H4Q26_016087 [Puccinia striiformis f. sp. tritici PST-130]
MSSETPATAALNQILNSKNEPSSPATKNSSTQRKAARYSLSLFNSSAAAASATALPLPPPPPPPQPQPQPKPIGGYASLTRPDWNHSTSSNKRTNPNQNGKNTSQLEAKVVILGMQGVGKTSIVHRYTTGSFSYSLTSTIGASFCTKKLSVDGCKVRLQIWDTAGQERFRSMAPMYYRGANAAILVYDITNKESFLDIQNWLNELRENMSTDLIIQVVGSKSDLGADKRTVNKEEAQAKLGQWTMGNVRTDMNGQMVLSSSSSTSDLGGGLPDPSSSTTTPSSGWTHIGISEVSAKDDLGIEDLFLVLSRRLVLRKSQIDSLRNQRSRDSILVHSHSIHNHNHLDVDRDQPLREPGHNPSSIGQTGFCC